MKSLVKSIFCTTIMATALPFAIIPALAAPAPALPQHWELDLSHTRIGFEVEHLGYSTTMGRFKKAEGAVHYNIKNPNATTMRFSVDTSSIDTGWEARDEHLRGKDFFNSSQYPVMSFVSTNVKFVNPQQALVTGDFTMLGKTKPLTLNVTLKKIATSPMTEEPVIGFRATGVIDRSAYGMTAYAKAITNAVPIQIDGELTYIKMN